MCRRLKEKDRCAENMGSAIFGRRRRRHYLFGSVIPFLAKIILNITKFVGLCKQ